MALGCSVNLAQARSAERTGYAFEVGWRVRMQKVLSPSRGPMVLAVSVVVSGLSACTPQPSSRAANSPAPPQAASELPRLRLAAVPLRSLTPAEQQLETELRADVQELLSAGERNTGNEWGLAVATDNLATRLESWGLVVEREGFVSADGALAQNLIVNLRGTDAAAGVVLVGARFDSLPGSPGADDNASGVAALLALARWFKDKPHARSLRLAWFSDASKRTVPESMGAWEHLSHLGRRAVPESEDQAVPVGPFRACVELHGLGVYSEALDSQGYPEGMPMGHPIGEFVEVVALAQDSSIGAQVAEAMGRVSSVPLKSTTWLEAEAQGAMTGFRAFAEHHCPAVLVSDTQRRRFDGFGTNQDTMERLDFARLARVTAALRFGIEALLDADAPSVPAP